MARAIDRMKDRSSVNIISVDVGTTTIACHHFDRSGISLYSTTRKVGDVKQTCDSVEKRRLRTLCIAYVNGKIKR